MRHSACPGPLVPLQSSATPLPFSIYPYLQGVEGDVADHVDIEYAARVLGQLIAYLQGFPVPEALSVGLPEVDDAIESSLSLAQRRARTIPDVVARLSSDAMDPSALRRTERRVVLHDDLWSEHILIDPESGRVTAVIDWADAAIGDPARDYAGLLAWFGEDFLVQALESGGILFDSSDLARARFFALTAGVNSIALGRQMNKPRWVTSGERALKNTGGAITSLTSAFDIEANNI